MLHALLALLGDMWRGNGQWTNNKLPNKRIGLLIVGLCVCFTIGWSWWAIPFLVYLNIAGVALGTGDPMGKIVTGHAEHLNDDNKSGNWEKWQYIIKTDNGFTNHGILGFLWYLPCLFMFSIDPLWSLLPVIAGLSFYISGFISQLFPKKHQWKAMEGLRSFITVLVLGLF